MTDPDEECEDPTSLLQVFNLSKTYHDNDADRADFCNQREMLWKAMHGFSNKCEKQSKKIVELFFTFLE